MGQGHSLRHYLYEAVADVSGVRYLPSKIWQETRAGPNGLHTLVSNSIPYTGKSINLCRCCIIE